MGTETNLLAIPPIEGTETGGHIFQIIYGTQENTNIIDVRQDVLRRAIFSAECNRRSERLLIEAVRNLIRKDNFSELNESLNDGEISEEEFESILVEESDKYEITLRNMNSPIEVFLISELIEKIGFDIKDFSTSEVAEMFSVKEDQLLSNLSILRYNLK